MVAALGAFLLRNQPEMQAVGTGLLVVAYACIFGGLVIDWLKVRPARRAAMEGRTASSGKSKDGAEKDSAQPETTDDSDE
jgi:hypothetical protein